jgi:hypothetical protein
MVSRALAHALGIETRWLPTATPELNACEGLWRGAKGAGLANRASQSINAAADAVCRYLLALTPRQRLQQAEILSGHFWLATKSIFVKRLRSWPSEIGGRIRSGPYSSTSTDGARDGSSGRSERNS